MACSMRTSHGRMVVYGKNEMYWLDVAKRRPVQIADHVRRHTKDPADLRPPGTSGFRGTVPRCSASTGA